MISTLQCQSVVRVIDGKNLIWFHQQHSKHVLHINVTKARVRKNGPTYVQQNIVGQAMIVSSIAVCYLTHLLPLHMCIFTYDPLQYQMVQYGLILIGKLS